MLLFDIKLKFSLKTILVCYRRSFVVGCSKIASDLNLASCCVVVLLNLYFVDKAG